MGEEAIEETGIEVGDANGPRFAGTVEVFNILPRRESRFQTRTWPMQQHDVNIVNFEQLQVMRKEACGLRTSSSAQLLLSSYGSSIAAWHLRGEEQFAARQAT
eukprot:CAMPEP_0178389628 /NCGR_PEP_ID=MMETSP0689_2-20121128/10222_1 /TAXON_ID=160604 /ORGANISM="Amphidinium massartii, Strain CS-259" /LENGTH=102 /DNA_ID=CAMNT_0020010099 /DNA_START=380 /DNA_END=688 /DNA_ORIENTATION=-